MGIATVNARGATVELHRRTAASLLVRERKQMALYQRLQDRLDALNEQRLLEGLPPLLLAVRFCFDRPVDAPLWPRIAVRYLRQKPVH